MAAGVVDLQSGSLVSGCDAPVLDPIAPVEADMTRLSVLPLLSRLSLDGIFRFLVSACVLGLAVAANTPHGIAQEPADIGAQADTVSQILRELYETDQTDRQFTSPPSEEEWRAITRRDRERRAQVLELVRAGALRTADDYYHAAMVLQHGEGAADVLIAHVLATVAGFRGHEGGRWLSAAALDRFLHRIDQPQRLGTQYQRDDPDDPWTQEPYERWLPDAVREAYGVRPLEEQEAYVRGLNDGK